jgi:glycosyltransferase involved in cell wall biosynthesis
MDVLVHPSETENCPRAVLEAQAVGLPVVGFRVGGMPEVVEDGRSGILTPPFETKKMAEAIVSLLKDTDRREAMARAARRHVETRYELQQNLARLTDLMQHLAGQ